VTHPSDPTDPSIETDAERKSEKELGNEIEKAEKDLPKPQSKPDHASDGGII
jgi:hypothetical protein